RERAVQGAIGGNVARGSAVTDRKATVRIPISLGELADRVTILEIKCERVISGEKRRAACDELAALRSLLEESVDVSEARLAETIVELRKVNFALWEAENKIRECERQDRFDDSFIALARLIYRTNDRRSQLKATINRLTNSPIEE